MNAHTEETEANNQHTDHGAKPSKDTREGIILNLRPFTVLALQRVWEYFCAVPSHFIRQHTKEIRSDEVRYTGWKKSHT